MGRLRGGPSRTGAKGAYLDRYVTDEQRGSRPIFNATLRAAASWPFFRVARSTRMTQIWALLPPVRLGPRLEKQPIDLRRNSRDLGDGTLVVMISLNCSDTHDLAFPIDQVELPVILVFIFKIDSPIALVGAPGNSSDF